MLTLLPRLYRGLSINRHNLIVGLVFFLTENCFSVASEYTGSTKHTTSGHTCQAWASNLPHRHKYHTDSYFPDKSVQAAGNKCRSPDNDVTPWCYTTNPYVLWEYCNVSKCEGKWHLITGAAVTIGLSEFICKTSALVSDNVSSTLIFESRSVQILSFLYVLS
jgi:hypothetical protein